MLGFIILFTIIFIALIIYYMNSEVDCSNNSNLTLDVDRMYRDSMHVDLGDLSKAEFERRKKSGYYMVQKGQEYSFIDELRKKRVQSYFDDWIE